MLIGPRRWEEAVRLHASRCVNLGLAPSSHQLAFTDLPPERCLPFRRLLIAAVSCHHPGWADASRLTCVKVKVCVVLRVVLRVCRSQHGSQHTGIGSGLSPREAHALSTLHGDMHGEWCTSVSSRVSCQK